MDRKTADEERRKAINSLFEKFATGILSSVSFRRLAGFSIRTSAGRHYSKYSLAEFKKMRRDNLWKVKNQRVADNVNMMHESWLASKPNRVA